jgi:hypothetical protein
VRQSVSLESLLAGLAADIGAVAQAAATIEYSRGSIVFAAVAGNVAELRLNQEVAEAAQVTPATTASRRGPGWVRFAPPELDQLALDRARAWFLSAWRNAG